LHLTDQEKAILQHYLGLLLDADEPLAFLGALRRVAELKAFSVTQGKIEPEDGQLWTDLAKVLERVEKDLHMFIKRS
jgi:hypothetical protein